MPLTMEQKNQVMELRKQNNGYGTIAKIIGSNKDTVKDYCKRKGMGGLLSNYEPIRKTYKCKYCGNEFYRDKGRNDITYCSDECKQNAKEKRKAKTKQKRIATCNGCGKEYEAKSKRQIYCTSECRYEMRTCVACGKEFKTLRNSETSYCSKRCIYEQLKKTHEQFYMEFSNIFKGTVVPITKYSGCDNEIKVYCLECNKETTRKAGVFIDKKRGCSHCKTVSKSTGEEIVKSWLDAKGVSYIPQYKHEDVVDQMPLSFDFAVTDSGGKVMTLIEYNGRQHYEPVEQFGGDKEYQRQLRSDKIKSDFAKRNNIKLISIHYKDKNKINKILTKEL